MSGIVSGVGNAVGGLFGGGSSGASNNNSVLGGLAGLGALGFGAANAFGQPSPPAGTATPPVNTPGYSLYQGNLTPNPASIGNSLYQNLPALFNSFANIQNLTQNATSALQSQMSTAMNSLPTNFYNYLNQLSTANNNFLGLLGLPQLASGGGTQGASGVTVGGGFNPNISPILAPLQQIENARQASTSTLADSLAQRGVLGSSFGGSQLSGMNADFANASANAALQMASTVGQWQSAVANSLYNAGLGTQQTYGQLASALASGNFQGLNSYANQIGQQQSIVQTALTEELQQLGLASGQTTAATAQLNQNSQFAAQLAAQEAAGQGAFTGFASTQLPNLFGNIGGNLGAGGGAGIATTAGEAGGGLGIGSSSLFGDLAPIAMAA